MSRHHVPQPAKGVLAQGAGVFKQTLALDHSDRRQPRRAGDGIFLVRVMAQGLAGHNVQIRAGDQRGQRKNPAAQRLADHQHVGDDSVMLAGEHLAGAAEAVRNLVEDQQRAVFVACGAHLLPIVQRRNERRAAHGLADDGGDIALLRQHILDVIGAKEVARRAAFERAMPIVRRRHVLAAGQQRAGAAAEDGLAADRNRVE